jgi:hypothetical protein
MKSIYGKSKLKPKNFLTGSIWENWGSLPNRSTSLDPRSQISNKCALVWATFSVYIHESWTLGKPYGIKGRCYWEQFEEHLGNLGNLHGNMMKTHWEPMIWGWYESSYLYKPDIETTITRGSLTFHQIPMGSGIFYLCGFIHDNNVPKNK